MELPAKAQDQSSNVALMAMESLLAALATSSSGLSAVEAAARLTQTGPNALPPPPPVTWWMLAFRHLRSPFMLILLFALVLSWVSGHGLDAAFIGAVILLTVMVGVIQEWGAERSAEALRSFIEPLCLTMRDGVPQRVAAKTLVPGDVVLVESGDRIPADLRLLEAEALQVEESMLTGESLPVRKAADPEPLPARPVADEPAMLFAGALVTSGRGRALVIATGPRTVLGKLASSLATHPKDVPPLVQRMNRLAHQLSIAALILMAGMVSLELWRGRELIEVALYAIALAVSAIPEGLPVAVTIVLAVAVHRLSSRRVIVRRLVAVESLGSCTYIATDKTGTLTENQLQIRRIVLPGSNTRRPEEIAPPDLARLAEAGARCNEATRIQREGVWIESGDTVDLAFLRLADQVALSLPQTQVAARLPYESVRQGAAIWIVAGSGYQVFAKGAPEALLPRCENGHLLEAGVEALASQGYKVLVVATKASTDVPAHPEAFPEGLEALGLVGLQDPIRPEVPGAIARCQQAGIIVAMITGDHPATAWTIGQELGLATDLKALVTGPQLREATPELLPSLIERGRVFARVDPGQKLTIVQAVMASGEAVAVTGDGANDAPALRAAHVGVAMGQRGTDIARESSELILTDDNFASLVNGIEEGRVAYANVRKVIYLLISTSVAEILLVVSALLPGLPVPLTAVQLLWLNLVTEGIQGVGLAHEPAEGDELTRPPRPMNEPIFNRVMIERVILSGLVMGGVCWWLFTGLLAQGVTVEMARNQTLLLMVLFQNIQVGVCRSETRSAFTLNPLRSPLLLWGTLTATLVHIGAMHWPVLQRVLDLAPVSPDRWALLLALSLTILVASELHKGLLRGSKLAL